ncbi:MAG: hypothetical protein ACXWP5_07870 [Bdellovibrionota bacterium]
MPKLLRWPAISPALVLALSCASGPGFKPSEPLDEAPSQAEGLLLCAEYQFPVPATRPIVLKPMLRCLDELAREFPAEDVPGSQAFRRELHLRWDSLSDLSWDAESGLAYNLAIHAVLRHLWRGGAIFPTDRDTPEEREAVLRLFPWTARILGAFTWPVARSWELDPELERLRAGITGLEAPSIQTRPAKSPEHARACGELSRLDSAAEHLSSVFRDENELTELAPESQDAVQAREMYTHRRDAALQQLESLKPELSANPCSKHLTRYSPFPVAPARLTS